MNKKKFKIYLYFKPLIIKLWTKKDNSQTKSIDYRYLIQIYQDQL